MKEYTKPEMEIIELEEEVILASGCTIDGCGTNCTNY